MTPRSRPLAALTLVGWMLAGAPAALAAQFLFVANSADDTVSVIDCDQDREIKIIAVGKSPQGLAVRTRDPLVAVANAKARFASLIDPLRLEALPDSLPTGMGPEDVAFSADGTVLFATSYYDKTVTFTDVRSRTAVAAPLQFAAIPRQLLLSPGGDELFVLLHDEQGAVVVVDPASRTVRATIPVGPFPTGMALTSDGSRLFVPSFDATKITVVDVRTSAVVDTLSLETGAGIAVHPFKPLLYSMLNFDGAVLVADYMTRQSVATIEVGGAPVSGLVTPDGRFLYAVNNDSGNVAKIDTETNTALVRIAVGAEPTAVVLFDRGGGVWLHRAGLIVLAIVAAGLATVWQRRQRRASRSLR